LRNFTFAILVASFPLSVAAQQVTATELSVGGAAVIARHTFVGGELGIARRPGTDTRIAVAVAGGSDDGDAAGRAQLTFQMLVNPTARTGMALVAGVGAAASARRGSPGKGWLVALLGLEPAPGRRQGWYLELGLSGGVRLAAGWRLRTFPAWWR
jgi:hypothetical protein